MNTDPLCVSDLLIRGSYGEGSSLDFTSPLLTNTHLNNLNQYFALHQAKQNHSSFFCILF